MPSYWFENTNHYNNAPCWEQPGKQQWHLVCALKHPVRFARSRGPKQWRYSGRRTLEQGDKDA